MKRLFFVCLSLLLCLGFMAVLAEETECTSHAAACTAPNVCVRCGHVEEGMGIGTGYCDYSVYHSYKDYHVPACSNCGMEKYGRMGELETEGHGRNCYENFCFTCGATDCNFIFVGHDPDTFVTVDLGDTHADLCGVCNGYEEQSIGPHTAECTNPSVCYTCGHANPENVWHRNMSSTWTNLGTTHGKYCSTCQTYVDEGAHQASCSDPTTCTVCGATDVVCEVGHNAEVGWTINGDTHTSFWSCCNQVITEGEKHLASCAAPDKCVACGAEGEGFQLTHTGETIWNNDDTTHWLVWNCCSTKSGESSAHIAACTDKTTCILCKAEKITATVSHNSEYKLWYDDEGHWNGCIDCGEPFGDKFTHEVYCPELEAGCMCGFMGEADIIHVVSEFAPLESDENTHWWMCICGKQKVEEPHYKSDCASDECDTCGYVGENIDTNHNFSIEYIDDTYHAEVCSDCGESTQEKHYRASCLTNTCPICEGTFSNPNPIHSWDDMEYDENGCWYTCLDCGETVDNNGHWYICSAPNTCANCGYVSPTATQYDHAWTEVYEKDNPDYHYKHCTTCGGEYGIASHTVSCANPGVCTGCGATGITVDEIKHGNVTWEHNATKHWGVCSTCGGTQNEGPHWTDCSKPNLCQDCGATGVTIDPSILSHFDVDWNNYEHDATHHWYTCRTCNIKAFYEEHAVNCTSAGACADCGYVGDFDVQHPVLKAGWESDENNHWKICAVCSDAVNKAAHEDENRDDKCDICKAQLVHKHYWGEPVIVDATCTADGSKTTTCDTCGEKTVETIASTGHAWDEPVIVEATCTADGSKTIACANCDEKTVETIASTGHAWGEPVIVEATCTADGSKTIACANCGEKTVETIASTGHAWGEPVIVEATCTADGSKTITCATCGEKTVEVIKSTGHAWGEPVIVEATCTADGSKTITCATCGEKTVEVIASTGHAWGEPVIVEATCTEDGSKTITCATCGEKTVEVIKSTGHAWGEPVIVEATCTADGSKTITCATCGEKTAETIAATGHAWSEPVIVEATCTADGSKTITCATCGEKTVEVIKSTGHAWSEPVIVDATCTEDGSKTIACANCDEKTVETIAAIGHAWGEPVTVPVTCTTDGNKTTTCANCGEETVEVIRSRGGHNWKITENKAATCTADGRIKKVCSVCHVYTVIVPAATGHAWGAPVTVPATCTADGSMTTTCANCGEKIVENIAAKGHVWGEPVTIPATCTADGNKTTTCTTCGEKTLEAIASTGHVWGEPVTVPATCTVDGNKTITCTTCGKKTVEVIAATGHAYGLVYTTQGNGTHAKTCSVCGAIQSAKCSLTTTNMGSMTCSACATCGYTVYTFNEVAEEKPAEPENTETTQAAADANTNASAEKVEESAPAVTEAKAETVVKRVENVSFELVEPVVEETKENAADENVAAETVEPDDSAEAVVEAETAETAPEAPADQSEVVLVVHETKVEMKVELPDTVTAEVKKVLAVSLLKEGNAIQPAATVKLSIPVVEEEVTGLKLMLMTDSGELVEVEYEIVDGVIVFATDMVGVFLFVDAQA